MAAVIVIGPRVLPRPPSRHFDETRLADAAIAFDHHRPKHKARRLNVFARSSRVRPLHAIFPFRRLRTEKGTAVRGQQGDGHFKKFRFNPRNDFPFVDVARAIAIDSIRRESFRQRQRSIQSISVTTMQVGGQGIHSVRCEAKGK
jgi:hypothetical protein